ncbi:MAG: hypothetical protein R3Y11_02285 [Pseudomonadota bacterium]
MARKIGKAYCLAKGGGHVEGHPAGHAVGHPVGHAVGQPVGHAVGQPVGTVDELGAYMNKGLMANMALERGHDRALPFDYATQCHKANDSCSQHSYEGQRKYRAYQAYASKVVGNTGNTANAGTLRAMPSMDMRLERSQSGTFQSKMRQTGLMTLETKEYRCLLGLYYAAYDEAKNPSASTEAACLQALEKCNAFYADGDVWP